MKLRLLGLWGASALAAMWAIGCSSLDLGATEDELALEEGRTKDNVLTDNELLGVGANTVSPTAAQIQKFLERTTHGGNPGVRSVLADKKIPMPDGSGDVPVSQVIYNAAKLGGVNPLALLVRLQLEQSLVGSKAGALTEAELDRRLSIAFGCGCPHAPICKVEPQNYTGFYQQVSCAVKVLKQHYDTAKARGKTSSGWGVGVTVSTQDESEVTPENIATAVLYTYTPYAGEDYGGQPSTACKTKTGEPGYCAGNALHTFLWDSYATAIAGVAGDAGRDARSDSTVADDDSGFTPRVDSGTVLPPPPVDPPEPPPIPGECSTSAQCAGKMNGTACLSDNKCGCYSSSDCTNPSYPSCNTSTQRCTTASPQTPPSTTPPYTPPYTPPGSSTEEPTIPPIPLYDAGATRDETAAATPAPTAPRPADDPSTRPAPGVAPGDVGYSTNNPYGENTSYTDGGKSKKKKNAAKDTGGCSVTAAGSSSTPAEVPGSLVLVGAALALAARRRKHSK